MVDIVPYINEGVSRGNLSLTWVQGKLRDEACLIRYQYETNPKH